MEKETARKWEKSIFKDIASANKVKRKHKGNIYNFTDSEEEDFNDINGNMKINRSLRAQANKGYLSAKLPKENKHDNRLDPSYEFSKEPMFKNHAKIPEGLRSPVLFSDFGNSEPESPVFRSSSKVKHDKSVAEKVSKKRMHKLDVKHVQGSSKCTVSSQTYDFQVNKAKLNTLKNEVCERKRQGNADKMEKLLDELESSSELSPDSNSDVHPKRITAVPVKGLCKVKLKKCRAKGSKTVTSKYSGKTCQGAENFGDFVKQKCNTKGATRVGKQAETGRLQESPAFNSSLSDTSSSQFMECVSADDLTSSCDSFQANECNREKVKRNSQSPVNSHKCLKKGPSPYKTEKKLKSRTSDMTKPFKKSDKGSSSEKKDLSFKRRKKPDEKYTTISPSLISELEL